jgi:hypothetical protein
MRSVRSLQWTGNDMATNWTLCPCGVDAMSSLCRPREARCSLVAYWRNGSALSNWFAVQTGLRLPPYGLGGN